MKKANWTPEQTKVIELCSRNILVSAAAGSGKTATLVERIVRRITEGAAPLNIDQLLIVTFTRAAAAEMKERIGAAIEKLREEQPENAHLQRQSLLLHNAQISTIDSFCMNVIQNYFHEIDLDPVFRIADEDELTLLRHEVIQDLLEDWYEQGDEAFLSFSQTYGGKHQDKNLEDYILRLYHFSTSCAWPEKWLQEMLCQLDKEAGLEETDWLEQMMVNIRAIVTELAGVTEKALAICHSPEGPEAYAQSLLDDADALQRLIAAKDYNTLSEEIRELKFTALSRKKQECAEEKKEQVKGLRDRVKKAVEDLKKSFFFQSSGQMQEDMKKAVAPATVLIQLTLEFIHRLAAKKEEKNLLDFSDVEHFALNILVEEQDGVPVARTAAKELRRQYEEIMIDEYQDSNEVQETILCSISREEEGTPNVFMVGDVKQSIYRFRLAKPELFMKKYHSYTKEESAYQKIDLQKNFRSRREVLEGTNSLFYRIMGEAFGGVEYDTDAALYTGREYIDREGAAIDNRCELICLNGQEDTGRQQESEDAEEYSAKELEALQTAKQIQKLMRDFTVTEGDGLRACRYSDIVILLRTMSGWSEVYTKVLAAQGIPVIAETQSGYFDVLEIKWLLNYLRITDNPLQDIPLASVLLSPFGGLNEEELAAIRLVAAERMPLWSCVCAYIAEKQDETAEKLRAFKETLDRMRVRAQLVPVTELLNELYAATGYDSYVTAMPAGEQRYQNLCAFAVRAAAFERTSYQGLFQFIRYVERLIKYNVDYGEAAVGAQENAVRIMSIHKSKGLEFPVVIVGGMTKKFNASDMRERVIFHPVYGLALDYIDETERTRIATLKKKAVQMLMTEEMLGEELRILYVAMTRAKEKLYLTGYFRDYERQLEKWELDKPLPGNRLGYQVLSKAGSYMDFIGPVRSYLTDFCETVVDVTTLTGEQRDEEKQADISAKELLEQAKSGGQAESSADGGGSLRMALKQYLEYVYPYEAERQLPVKTSVSELKKQSYDEEEFVPVYLSSLQEAVKEQEIEGLVPEFLKEQKQVKGTDRGTLYHRLLEQLPVKYQKTEQVLQEELAELVRQQKLDKEELAFVSVKKLAGFYASELARRMELAAASGTLYQEQPFVFGVPARELYEVDSDEIILIQGIIDVFFEEDGALVLADYKTDRLGSEPEETLRRRYTRQMQLYRQALEQITGKQVKEMQLYSFALQKCVEIVN